MPSVLNCDFVLIVRSALSHDFLKALFCPDFHEWTHLSPNPCCSISSHLDDNGLHPISFPLKRVSLLISPGKKLPDIFLAFPQTISYCSSFFLPSITDEVTIYSIIFLVLESMELLFPFWRINILSWTCTSIPGFNSFLQLFDSHMTRACSAPPTWWKYGSALEKTEKPEKMRTRRKVFL